MFQTNSSFTEKRMKSHLFTPRGGGGEQPAILLMKRLREREWCEEPNYIEDVLPREIERLVLLELKAPAALACVARASKGLFERVGPLWKEHCRRVLAAVGPDAGACTDDDCDGNAITLLREAEEAGFPNNNAEALCRHVFKEASRQMALRLLGCVHAMLRNEHGFGRYASLNKSDGTQIWFLDKVAHEPPYIRHSWSMASRKWTLRPATRRVTMEMLSGGDLPLNVVMHDAVVYRLITRAIFVTLTDIDTFACLHYTRSGFDGKVVYDLKKTGIREGLFSSDPFADDPDGKKDSLGARPSFTE